MSALLQKNNPRKRHQLLSDDLLLLPKDPITTLPSLQAHLQIAIELEHSTIPPYLCALYSIREGTNIFATQTIKSVVMEEMLHMMQAANILNAIGGSPSINSPDFIPSYPTFLPDSDDSFKVHLMRFSKEALDTFIKIERPEKPKSPPEADKYHTIGQFYNAIKLGLKYVNEHTKGGIFTGSPSKQITAEQYYGGGGMLCAVHTLDDALLGINEIIGQGEGIPHSIEDPDHILFGEEIQYAHYFRYKEIREGRKYQVNDSPNKPPTGPKVDIDWDAVYPMHKDPKLADYKKGSPVWNKTLEFNRTYTKLLDKLHHTCNGQPDLLMKEAIPLMYGLKYQAQELLHIPIGNGEVAGPSFEYAPE